MDCVNPRSIYGSYQFNEGYIIVLCFHYFPYELGGWMG